MNGKTDYLTEFEPAYLELVNSGEIDNRIEKLFSKLEQCDICPRNCGVNRLDGEIGYCQAGDGLVGRLGAKRSAAPAGQRAVGRISSK